MALKNVIEKLKKEAGIDDDVYKSTEYINTGNYLFNAIISGDIDKGVPSNRILQFAGEESTGKTYLTLEICKNAQKQGYTILYFDSEFSISEDDLKKRGIDLEKFIILPVDSVESFREKLVQILDEYNPKEDGKLMMVLDSLGNLYTKKEYHDALTGEDKTDMTRAKLLKSVFRIATINCGVKQVPFIVLNHVYASLNSFIKQNVVSGGSGSKYASSIILELTKAQDKESSGQVVGAIITVKSIKNRLAKEKTKIKININFDKGLDSYSGLLDFAIQFGIVKDLGRKRIEFNGNKYSVRNLDENFWNEVFEKTDFKERIRQYFSYGEVLALNGQDSDSDDEELENEPNAVE